MQDNQLLDEFLAAENEEVALEILTKKGLLNDEKRWRFLGNMPNNQSVVHAQQSTAAAALVEKVTNAIDAILMRKVRAAGIDPRSPKAPQSMPAAVEKFYGDLSESGEIRKLAEESMVLYATGSNLLPSISLYDAGEGQLAEDFPKTFCSLIFGSAEGAYKGAVEFTQGRFNMGGTGVLPFCGDNRKMQLIVSRVPDDMCSKPHEWAFTVFCFFPHKSSPSWKYLVGTDGNVMTAGAEPLGLVPKLMAKSGELCAPRERKVPSGTLIKMYNFKAPRSNICGELFRKLEDYLLKPVLPLRLIECREHYKANVMQNTIWNRLAKWNYKKLEEGFEDGASVQIKLSSGETIPAEVRVFKMMDKDDPDQDAPQTGLRALINGQSHAKRDTQFFKTKAVDLEHIAGSMLVTLDCTGLSQTSRNAIFMANRETFREDALLQDLFKKLQKELRDHEGLNALNKKRYEEKIANATSDELGISALEELLANDPSLADLFSSMLPGKAAAAMASQNPGQKATGDPKPYVGKEYPTYFKRADGLTVVRVNLPKGDDTRVSFITDVKNNYFTRNKHPGSVTTTGPFEPSSRLFNGRLTLTFHCPKKALVGSTDTTEVFIKDDAGHSFKLTVHVTVVQPREKREKDPPQDKMQTQDSPSRPDVIEVNNGPEALPLTVERIPGTTRLQLALNKDSRLLEQAKHTRAPEEQLAVDFVFKYGLALIAMGLLENVKPTSAWKENEEQCRKAINEHCAGVARVIVPLCLTLPQKLPKAA
ncbi:hypothetical protein [Bradyrhizobium sp. RD5-C2]|uniref:hypothetical protein n=1 Tax=Bradyrhizobium sp. RD5-C2 TaxID=244562 RepID=UPI001CC571BF|nr:hypothetical protein [Bradyrhizobium sp. RD5-C2]GIQ75965.1 hypothetical protein BraRD5C2_44080 [Bradyrhizobium sp. RD5-C2]